MALTLRAGYLPGCIGRITELHGRYYARQAGFGVPFEALVARELGAFCARFRPGRDGLWLLVDDGTDSEGPAAIDNAEAAGRVHGSIAIDGAHAETEGAHLRWFIASDRVRGTGLGRRLLQTALAHADAAGFARVSLWTFAGLGAARHLYEAHGFRLDHRQLGTRWGEPVEEQRFVRGG